MVIEGYRVNASRTCKPINERGEPCRQAPQLESEYCFWHDPTNEEEAGEARRRGGIKRKRERTLQIEYELDSLASVAGIQRLLEIAAAGVLDLEHSFNRSRVLITAAVAAARLLETSDLETRMQSLEAVLHARPKPEPRKRGWWPR